MTNNDHIDPTKEYTINKTYTESISKNYQTKKFSTSLTTTIRVKSAQEFIEASDKLFAQAKALTERDISTIVEEGANND